MESLRALLTCSVYLEELSSQKLVRLFVLLSEKPAQNILLLNPKLYSSPRQPKASLVNLNGFLSGFRSWSSSEGQVPNTSTATSAAA